MDTADLGQKDGDDGYFRFRHNTGGYGWNYRLALHICHILMEKNQVFHLA
jgi:hypothetical protein